MVELEEVPRTVLPHADHDRLCGTCGTLPDGWPHNFNCRRLGKPVSVDSHACELWRERMLPPAIDWERMKLASEALLSGYKAPPVEECEPRHKPPPGLRGSTAGVVYFIDCGELTKIGISAGYVATRMRGMATDNPFKKTLWGLMPGYRKEEMWLHRELMEFHYQGEWFRFDDEIREELKRFIRKQGGEIYDEADNG